jgi:hypothetical protein
MEAIKKVMEALDKEEIVVTTRSLKKTWDKSKRKSINFSGHISRIQYI